MRAAARIAAPGAGVWSRALRPRGARGIAVDPVREAGPEFDALWEEASPGYRNVLVRDRAFLRWRFLAAPTRKYELLAARKNGRLLGYLASTTSIVQGLRWAMIMDLFVVPTREGRAAAARLVREHARRSRAAGADLTASLMFRHAPPAAGLKRNGFLIALPSLLPREFPILLRWNRPGPPDAGILDLKRWFMTMADYDAA